MNGKNGKILGLDTGAGVVAIIAYFIVLYITVRVISAAWKG